MYDNIRDAEFRLRATVVWYKGQYAYVGGVDQVGRKEFEVHLHFGDRRKTVDINDPELKIRSIPTGYVVVRGRVCYLKRLPTRTYRQGLRSDNSTTTRVNFNMFRDAVIEGNVGKNINDNEKILSKDYAVINGKLMYRGREVGIYHDGKPYLNNDKSFLTELLQEVTNG